MNEFLALLILLAGVLYAVKTTSERDQALKLLREAHTRIETLETENAQLLVKTTRALIGRGKP